MATMMNTTAEDVPWWAFGGGAMSATQLVAAMIRA
jgi:hypothetical protein